MDDGAGVDCRAWPDGVQFLLLLWLGRAPRGARWASCQRTRAGSVRAGSGAATTSGVDSLPEERPPTTPPAPITSARTEVATKPRGRRGALCCMAGTVAVCK